MMTYSDEALDKLTEASEGCRLKAYPDPGTGAEPWTIGYGHTYGVYEGMECTEEQANKWAMQDIAQAESAVNKAVKVKLTQHQFDALVDFTFNVGIKNFINSTLLKFLNSGDYVGANAQFSRWVHGGNGGVLPGLVARRKLESEWFSEDEK